ncbi:MAG: molecular chaperone HtpG [Oscillospiraceae bacterium]|nr:molecular chaperone HtpG [Oscillospiraceae bacterium]
MPKKQFKAESKRLLDLMINSIYTHKEIFLRELISNASDAIDKLHYLSLTDGGVEHGEFAIRVSFDKDARTVTVSDNGVGMDRDELENNLGVIAASGSYRFRQEVGERDDVDVIGQFGVGFYAAFMVADEITVVTKKYGSGQAYRWQSSGADGYTVAACEKDGVGTDVVLRLKPDAADETYSEYLDGYRLRGLIKKYSDYVRYPIRMPSGAAEEWETVNSMTPLWQRKRGEVTDEEYAKFYQGLTRDFEAPQRIVTVATEGGVTYKALLFVPASKPMRFNTEAFEAGLQLYSAGVLIMDKCDALLPDYLRFVRGVVDSPDLSLNISRELLQHDRQLRVIAKNLEKKVLADLEKFLKDDRAGYERFYANFGRALCYGVAGEGGETRRDSLRDLLLFYSSAERKLTSLREYVDRMPEAQKYIYYAAGESVAQIDALPQTELLKDRKYEVLYLTGDADEFVLQALQSYADKPFRSIVDGDLELPDAEDAAVEEKPELMQFVKDTLGDKVKEVKASRRLKTHPACMAAGAGLSFEMEKYFKSFDLPQPMRAERVLELNTAHPAVLAMEAAMAADRPKAERYARILYDQALLIAGLPLDDPSAYTDLIAELMV